MPTIYTHGIVGLGAAGVIFPRCWSWLFWILSGFLPMIPDLDAFSPAAYGTPFGHRGFTHSFLFALAIGLLAAGLSFKYLRMRFWSLALFFFILTALGTDSRRRHGFRMAESLVQHLVCRGIIP